ncbi:hypothetical protein QEH68_06735 [Paenarthrobacter sp. OM7]|uniref:phage tail tube protein n=1 Tax=Paenarthrobacter sp. OM7 TaxID=3041264 RepID=UPI002468B7D0|nr:hypothetical protein [Paenarthrobacter sp. OM7]WGM21864.1 hypothetical protein QEH68_06735 [Paenarthrobacter sp. OM7]
MAQLGPKMLTDANRRLWWVPSIANYHAPKISEVTAGKDISQLITAADYALGATSDDSINDPAWTASSNSTAPGRTNYEAAMNFFRFKNAIDDTAWTTFTGKNIGGFLVERIGQIEEGEKAHEVALAAADEVRVFQVLTNTPQVLSPSGAGYEKFRQVFSVQDLVDERAIVAVS